MMAPKQQPEPVSLIPAEPVEAVAEVIEEPISSSGNSKNRRSYCS